MSKDTHNKNFSEYEKAVAFVESFSNISFRKNFGPQKRDPAFFLDRTRHFLKLLNEPDQAFNYIHVTGTAGKGSVCKLLSSILSASGAKTGLFTSPYVTTTAEQIQVDGRYISAPDFVRIVDYLKLFIAQMAKKETFGPPSAFEILLTIALIHFREQKCSWVVIEVGLGGRFDATNFMEKPAVTAITNIDYDHTEILGKTLKEISYDKAGIIKPGSLFFTSESRTPLLKTFKKICMENSATFQAIPQQDSPEENNLTLVRSICSALNVKEEAIQTGIKEAKLPCRFEIMSKKSPSDPLIILDGAHNRAKIRSTIQNLAKIKYNKLIVILSISNTKKDNLAIIAPLAKVADYFILTSTNQYERRSLHPKILLPLVNSSKRNETKVEVIEDCYKALERARQLAAKAKLKKSTKKTPEKTLNETCILVTGSFFLAGQLRYVWYPEEEVLRKRSSF